jgi:hypothetical protein
MQAWYAHAPTAALQYAFASTVYDSDTVHAVVGTAVIVASFADNLVCNYHSVVGSCRDLVYTRC